MSRTPEYRAWKGMFARCTYPNNKSYEQYKDREISPAFKDFMAFFKEVGPKPKGTSLERKDNNRGYIPGNIKWATRTEQNRNTSANRVISFLGKSQPLSQWCEELKLHYPSILDRLLRGWPPHIALSAPIKPHTDGVNRRKHPESY